MSCFLGNSSVGRKFVMGITGCFLVLFLTFHMLMNLVAIADVTGVPANIGLSYEAICEFLGTKWYALLGTIILALGVAVHFIYAFILTFQNRRARGNVRYAMTVKEKGVDWASKNMLVLGLIVILGLLLHLFNFWSKMQLVELLGHEPASGVYLIAFTFSKWYYVILYLVWLSALWFHLTHGVWSMFQTVGWANDIWYPRLKCIANIVATLLVLGFAAVIVTFFIISL